jgi:hypothetical protein
LVQSALLLQLSPQERGGTGVAVGVGDELADPVGLPEGDPVGLPLGEAVAVPVGVGLEVLT